MALPPPMTAAELVDMRLGMGLTQARLAAHLGIDPAHLSRMERGERPIAHWQLLYWALRGLAHELGRA